MLTYLQAIFFGALQGVTELFPISSLGHTVILPKVIGWDVAQYNETFVIFIVATHVATALVLLGFFWKDWIHMMFGFFRSVQARKIPEGDTYAKLIWLIIVATIPAGLLGLLLDKKIESLFDEPARAALFLIANGFLLYGAELLRKKRAGKESMGTLDEGIVKISFLQSFGIGAMQALALFPGISRTGSALAGGLLAKLNHEEAARFSFFLATPLILAAGVLKLPKLIHISSVTVLPILAGSVISALAAYLSVRFLSRYFKHNTLIPFAIYCVVAGVIAYLAVR